MTQAHAKPRYLHDCDCCQYLGRHTSEHHGEMDLYAHSRGRTTVIARFGDHGSEYLSGLYAAYGADADLTEARQRAEAAGLLAYDVYQALQYAQGEAGQARLRQELPDTPLYQAYLAHSCSDPVRAQQLIVECHAAELARVLQQDAEHPSPRHTREYPENDALCECQRTLVRMLEAMEVARGIAAWTLVLELTQPLQDSLRLPEYED